MWKSALLLDPPGEAAPAVLKWSDDVSHNKPQHHHEKLGDKNGSTGQGPERILLISI
jgi:hypothetical protein